MITGPDLLQLDGRIEQAVIAWRAWRKLVRVFMEQALEQDPFAGFRQVSTRATWQAVQELPPEIPQREAMSRWVAALTLDRATFEDRRDAESSRRSPDHTVRRLGPSPFSIRGLVLEASLHADAKRREIAAETLLQCGEDASSNALFWASRRHDAATQLGLASLEELEAPLRGEVTVEAVADRVLRATDDLADAVLERPRGWQEAIAAGIARDAVDGWPAQLGVRWLHLLFGGSELTRGIHIDLTSVEPAMAGASFARALAQFGRSYARGAGRASARSFTLAERPFDLLEASFGSLFSGLLSSAAFNKRRLGLGQTTARLQARSFVRSQVVALRIMAVQAAVAACADADAARTTHEIAGSRALRATLPAELAGVVPRYRPSAASRLLGALHAASWRERLVHEHDEDWFDNPRAHTELRQIDALHRATLDENEANEGIEAFVRSAAEVLT